MIFVLISGWHFGETDLTLNRKFLSVIIQLMYGLCIILWLVLGHDREADTILSNLINFNSITYKAWIFLMLYAKLFLSFSGTLILIILIIMLYRRKYNKCQIIKLLTILSCCYIIPLLLAFVIYFVGWHSVVTLQNLHKYLNGNKVENYSLFKLWMKALPFTLLAIFLLLLTEILINYYRPNLNLIPVVFIFISLITLPHIEVMHGLNKSRSVN